MFFSVSIFADSISGTSYVDYPFSVKFSGEQIVFTEERDGGGITISRKGRFIVECEYSISFMYITFEDSENKKLVMIRNDNICALFDEMKLVFLDSLPVLISVKDICRRQLLGQLLF